MYLLACRAGTPVGIDAVPALQAGEQFDGIYPGLRSPTRSCLGYNLAGLQPSASSGCLEFLHLHSVSPLHLTPPRLRVKTPFPIRVDR